MSDLHDDSHLNDLHPQLRQEIINMRQPPEQKFGYGTLIAISAVMILIGLMLTLL